MSSHQVNGAIRVRLPVNVWTEDGQAPEFSALSASVSCRCGEAFMATGETVVEANEAVLGLLRRHVQGKARAGA